jgi:CRISPR/Cas system-associated exonuclease Cas4 (RecB family)
LSKAELHQDIPAEYAGLGALDEFRYSAKLDKEKVAYQREVPFQVEYKGTVISGRMDFVLDNDVAVEKKSTTSQSVYKRAFEGGVPEPSWVAQAASYLGFCNKKGVRIVASYYELSTNMDAYEVVAEREWSVKSLDGAALSLDGKPYSHSLKDLARWYSSVSNILSTSSSATVRIEKPMQAGSKYESPCNFCPLKEICAVKDNLAWDVQELRQALTAKPTPRGFKIMHNTERRKKNRQAKKDS